MRVVIPRLGQARRRNRGNSQPGRRIMRGIVEQRQASADRVLEIHNIQRGRIQIETGGQRNADVSQVGLSDPFRRFADFLGQFDPHPESRRRIRSIRIGLHGLRA